MSFFGFYKSGFQDFIFLNIFGHLLFIIALCGVYTLSSWRTVYSFVFFFVLGYLVTFFADWTDIITIPNDVLKVMIPVSVIVTAFANFFVKKKVFTNRYPSQNFRYYFALVAGFIHGFAFANPHAGKAFEHALGYNLGIITCILITTFGLLLIAMVLTYFLRVRLREWNLIISGACAGIALFKIFLQMY